MNALRTAGSGPRRVTVVERAAKQLFTAELPSSGEVPAILAKEPVAPPPRRLSIDRLRLKAAGLAVPGQARSRLIEEIRALRVGLAPRVAAADDWRQRVLLVTSARPREGKTFIAVSLALTLAAEPERRVLLVDLDPARFGASRLLGAPPEPGLAELLADPPVDPALVFLRTDIPALSFVAPGQCGSDFPDRLSSRRLRALFAGMLQADPRLVIVIDAPPVLAGSEALSLLGCVGTVLFVVEAGRTPQRDIERALAPLRGQVDIGLVLNKTSADVGLGHYYEAYYGQGRANPRSGLLRRLLRGRAWVVLLAASLAVPPLMAAARLDLTPRLELATALTDNVSFAPKPEAEPALVGRATLGLKVTGRTSRSQLAADYAVSRFATLMGDGGQDTRQNLAAGLRAELLPDLLFVDAAASIGEETATDGGNLPAFAISKERITRYAVSLSPFLHRRLTDGLALEIRPRLSRTAYDSPVVADATALGAGLVLGAPRRGNFGWSVTAAIDQLDFEPSRRDPARSVHSRLLLWDGELSPIDGLILLLGAGWSELADPSLADGKTRGPYARLGAVVESRAGLRLEASYAQLYGEPELRAGLSAALGPATTLTASYRQRLVNRAILIAEEIAERSPLAPLGRAQPIADPDFRSLVPEIDLDLGTSATFRQRLGELALTRERGRNLLRAALYAERRHFDQPALDDEWRYGLEFGWRRRLTPRSDLQVLAEAQRIDLDGGGHRNEMTVELGWIHRLSPRMRLNVGYELARRDSSTGRDVLANTVFASLTREF